MGIQKQALSVAELAESLGICKPSAYELVKTQDFPSIQVSANRFVVPVDGLRIWLAKRGGYLDELRLLPDGVEMEDKIHGIAEQREKNR